MQATIIADPTNPSGNLRIPDLTGVEPSSIHDIFEDAVRAGLACMRRALVEPACALLRKRMFDVAEQETRAFDPKRLIAEDFHALLCPPGGAPADTNLWAWCVQLATAARAAKRSADVAYLPVAPQAGPPPVIVTRDAGFGSTSRPVQSAQLQKEEALLAKYGFVGEPLAFASGTPTMDCADDTYRRLYQEWADLPPTYEALRDAERHILAERRSYSLRNPAKLHFDTDGQHLLVTDGDTTLNLEPKGATQLFDMIRAPRPDDDGVVRVRSIFPSALDLFELGEPGYVAEFANRHLHRWAARIEDKPVQLGTRWRKDAIRPAVFMVASATYAAYPAHVAARDFADALRTIDASCEARGHVLYNPVTTDFDVHAEWMQSRMHNLSVGMGLRAGLHLGTNDAKGSAIDIHAAVVRARCINLTLVTWKGAGVSLRHTGDKERIAAKIAKAYRTAAPAVQEFIHLWGMAGKTAIDAKPIALKASMRPKRFGSVEEAIAYGIEAGKLKLTGSKERDAQAIGWGFSQEPAQTLEGLVNAVTRATQWTGFERQLSTFADNRRRLTAAELAGDLLPVLAGAS